MLRVLAEEGAPDKVVFHCFSGDAEMAKVCAERGYVMSFAGNVTFKNAGDLREAAAVAPAELLLVETDAPFLTPMPYRGRPNAPYLVPLTAPLPRRGQEHRPRRAVRRDQPRPESASSAPGDLPARLRRTAARHSATAPASVAASPASAVDLMSPPVNGSLPRRGPECAARCLGGRRPAADDRNGRAGGDGRDP